MTENKIAQQNSINNFLNTYFNLFVVVLISFLLVMSYFLVLKPKVDATTMAISDNISQQQRIYQAEQSKLLSLKSTIDSYKKIDPVDSERVNSILPNDYNKEKLFGELEEIITKNGYEPNSITLTKEGETTKNTAANTGNVTLAKASDKIGVINISLSIGSIDYANLKNFLGVLENNLRIFDITSVSLGERSATLQMVTYYYKK
ncbi:MAG: hypothetical protein WAW11_00595 [Patescibacteria group bacterium]